MKLLELDCRAGAEWSCSDTASKYQRNLELQPADWLWRTKPVHYNLNSQKYRAPEWDTVDWNNSIVFFGDSMVYGVGVDEEDTITHQLSLLTGLPVINLGQSETGLGFYWANAVILKEAKIKPKAVCYVWPDRIRQTEYLSDTKTLNYGPWNFDKSWMLPLATHNKHNYHWAKFMIRNLRLMWDCPIAEGQWYDSMSFTGAQLLPFNDYARDMEHTGPESHKLSASIFSSQLEGKVR
jgi:hypothetical protein